MTKQKNYAEKWFNTSCIYQIYPKSFLDTKGSGEGDLRGIIEKLDYLQNLGVGALWICPIFASPNVDNGYDISDYLKIQKQFGNLDDVKELIKKAHERDIKIIMDMVANHSSEQHEWFIKSCKKEKPYDDYYIWSKNPTNWASFFGGSAWSFNEERKEYYMRLFTKEQPDLNWHNENVRKEIYKIMQYWMDLGVDGFRLDAISHICKPFKPTNYESDEKYVMGKMHGNGVNIHKYFKEMHEKVLSKYENSIAIGEANLIPHEEAHLFVNPERKELDMIFTFDHMDCDRKSTKERGNFNHGVFDLVKFKKTLASWQENLFERGWNALYLNNHDQARAVSRFTDDINYRVEGAKMLALVLHFMQGTPFIYQGEEIGMTNTELEFDEIDDINTKQAYKDLVLDRKIMPKDEFVSITKRYCRDHSRTPMQWNDSENAGFSSSKTWMKVNKNYKEINVENALKDPSSVFYFYQKLIKLRKDKGTVQDILTYGNFKAIDLENKESFFYARTLNGKTILVLTNFTNKEKEFEIESAYSLENAKVLISNYQENTIKGQKISLKPYQGVAFKLF